MFESCVENISYKFSSFEMNRNLTLKFQIDPPFKYSDTVHGVDLEDSEVPAGTSVGVTGWGATSVSQ